jgi:hypothetical protein
MCVKISVLGSLYTSHMLVLNVSPTLTSQASYITMLEEKMWCLRDSNRSYARKRVGAPHTREKLKRYAEAFYYSAAYHSTNIIIIYIYTEA